MSTHTITPTGRTSSVFTGRPSSPTSRVAPAAGVRRGSLRLTRRGRVVVVVALLGMLLALGFTLGRVSNGHAAETTSTRVVVVQPGQTLWSIAARVAPHSDTRLVVARLAAMNHLQGGSVQVGERLSVPA